MGILLAVTVVVGVVLAIDLSWFPDAGAREPLTVDGERAADSGDLRGLDEGLSSAESVLRRLDALAEELDRLDHDPDVFARAFHTRVARGAHDALLAAGIPEAAPARPSPAACVLHAVPGQWSPGSTEVIEL